MRLLSVDVDVNAGTGLAQARIAEIVLHADGAGFVDLGGAEHQVHPGLHLAAEVHLGAS